MRTRWDRVSDYIAWGMIFLCLLAWVSACADQAAPRGSAQDQAAGASARASSLTTAADQAAVDAAAKRARADDLEIQAERNPTSALIAAAADARVEAAAAEAVSRALSTQAQAATTAAERASVLARQERGAELAAADLRWWSNLCRWIGLVGVAAGVILGSIIGWLVTPRLGILVGLLIVVTALACTAYGAALAWLPWAVGAAVLLGIAAWAIAHWQVGRVGRALSRALDMVEADPRDGLAAEQDAAKSAVAGAIKAAGLEDLFEKLRGDARDWKAKP